MTREGALIGPSPTPAGGRPGRPVPCDWGDEHYARAATGRTPLTAAERQALGADAARFPLFS
ncbi:hypothetical protein [Streptomyces coelicoflavus]|uniref:hypothetical protein n=1 Tax=Streptomyces coelicoflavus TaxID=285562 RepID=UPI002E2746E0